MEEKDFSINDEILITFEVNGQSSSKLYKVYAIKGIEGKEITLVDDQNNNVYIVPDDLGL